MLGRSLGVRLVISCQRPDAAAFPSGSRLNYGVILIVGAPIKSIYEMLIPKEYIDEIGDRNFKRGEGVALLQGSELRFIKIPMVRNMEKMQQICIDALTREESPVEGGGEAASPQTVGIVLPMHFTGSITLNILLINTTVFIKCRCPK